MKINRAVKSPERKRNRASGVAYEMTPEKKLLNLCATCLFGEDKYYGAVEEDIKTTAVEVAKKNPKFLLQLANYIRSELHLRTISVVLLAIAANTPKCKPYVRSYVPKIIQRADELTEAIAAHFKLFKSGDKKRIPNSLKKGVKDAFRNFDEYQLSKYNRASEVKLKDVIMLTHPKEPSELIKKILDDKLKVPETWETAISTKGSKKENWEAVLPKMGYMAVLRNINNFIKTGVPLDKFLPMLKNKEQVLKSKQLPFRFYSALNALRDSDPFIRKDIQRTLETALGYSVENLPKLGGRTAIAVDLSGSMDSSISERSTVSHKQISSLFGALGNRFSDNAVVFGFGDTMNEIHMTGNLLQDTEKIVGTDVGCSTNGWLVLKHMNEKKIKTDRIIYFTDEQIWDSLSPYSCRESTMQNEFSKYKKVNPEAKLYLVNVNGYGETCISRHEKNAMTINGFSDNILKFIDIEETDQVAYIQSKY